METEKIGLKIRPRKDGTTAYYWVASAVSRHAEDYPNKTVRVHGATLDDIAARCRVLTSELKQWLAEKGMGQPQKFDGTLRSLIRMYQTTKASSYFTVRSNTREMYDFSLAILERECGMRRLDKVTGLDIRGWYEYLKEPAEDTPKQAKQRAEAAKQGIILPPNPERPRRAYQCMQLLRIVISFGVVANIQECFRLKMVLESMTFHVPRGRTEQITFEQAEAVCNTAIARGLHSIALAQALQFELTLRQIDVIGRWEKSEDHRDGGILDRGQRWRDGLLWSHLDSNGILKKPTSKIDDVTAEHDTMQYPFLRKIIDMVPVEKRFGPMIRSEATGLPYRKRYFSDVWRECADAAGVPKTVWNRDSRAGGITEGSDAGADLEHLRHHANHKNAATTQRYNRKTLEKTQKVAQLRVAHRSAGNAPETDA
ncbi:site-specific integrase [Rhizobium leguminosarum]|uniref:site-specific integrase n=1 Tax=Rhizobium leguminosarum TaxID=384 RepID=UPI00103E38E8|nr:site-specific integrase [Rhizobium leguminosarum]TBY40876.1 site-specific integrase [Rhizobium leguminosarum bv. viciae]